MKEFRGAAALGAVCASLLTLPIAAASAQTPATPALVTRGEQAARDGERLRILRQELAREQSRASQAVRDRAERLSLRDPDGVRDAEQAQARANENVAALRREIENIAPSTMTAAPKPVTPAATDRAGPLFSPLTRADAPWWDVYGRAPRRDAASTPNAAAAPARPTAAALRTTAD